MDEPIRVNGVEGALALAGRHLGHTDWEEVTQQRVDLFAEATSDHQWLHVDPQRAAHGPYHGTVAHGYLTLSLTPYFLPKLVRIEGFAMGINYGTDRVRFPAPVPVGGKLRCGAQVDAAVEIPGGVQLTLTVTYEVQGQSKPSCVATIIVRHYL